MDSPLGSAVVSPVLVARDKELGSIDQLIDRLRSGEGATLLVSGEAGIGKSRLISEARRRFLDAESESGLVLQGNCFEVDRDYPLAPIADMLSRFALQHPELARDVIGPELASLVPDLDDAPAGSATTGDEQPVPHKRAMQQALKSLLLRLARGRPLLVIVEDLHWADEITLELLPHLSRLAGERPLLLIFSYRHDSVGPALRHLMTTLSRERSATELRLQPLQRRDVDLLLRSIFNQPHPIRADFLDMIHDLTDGNLFFIEEVLRALIAAGDIYVAEGHWHRKEAGDLRIPRSIQDAVLARTGGLSPASREVLSLAAVTGRHFRFRVIQELTGMDEPTLLACFRELVERQLIHEESADLFAFRHALTREAVYSELLLLERQRLHRAVAEAVERLGIESIDSRVVDLSYHYDAAGVWEKSYEYAVRDGDHAQAMFAPQAAADQFSRAIRASKHLALEPDPDLYRKRGLAYATLGQFELALQDLDAMLEIVRQKEDRALEWQAFLELGGLWTGRDYDNARAYFQEAYNLAIEMDEPRAIAHSLIQIGNWQANADQIDEAEQSLTAALDIFEQLDDVRGQAEAVDLLGVVADSRGDLSEMRERYGHASRLYQALDDRRGVASTSANVAVMAGAYNLFETISLAGGVSPSEAEAAGKQVIGLTRDIDWRSGEAYSSSLLSIHYGIRGRYDLAFDFGRRSLDIASEINHQEWTTTGLFVVGSLYADLLDHRRAVDYYEESVSVARNSGSVWMQRLALGFLAMGRVAEGERGEAEALLHDVRDGFPMHTMGQRLMWLARTKLALAQGNPLRALEVIDDLFATARNFTDEPDIPGLAKLRADALLAMERLDEAERSLLSARSGAVRYGLQPLLWRVHLGLGDLYRKTDRVQDAEAEHARARSIVEALAADVPDDTLRERFLSRALELIPGGRQQGAIFTSRERDVVELLAKGMSNREIADALFIGERTVETHVANILAKLGFTSRNQVAAWMAGTTAG